MYGYFNAPSRKPGSGVNSPLDAEGKTALHLAVAKNDEKAIHNLTRVGANPNQQDKEGQTPLFDAILHRNLAMTKLLVEKGASFTVLDDAKRSPLDWAIEKECPVDFIAELRRLGADAATPAKSTGRTALHLAAEKNRPDLIEYLVKAGVSVTAQDDDGDTPLHAAVEAGATEAVQKLLALKADPILRNNQIETPLHLAARKGNEAIADLLLAEPDVRRTINDFKTYSSGQTPLMVAAEADKPALIAKLAAVGGDVNQTDNNRRHSLAIAVEAGNVATARALIELGADTTKASPRGYNNASLVHEISSKNYDEMLLLLYSNGFDINAVDSAGNTPLNKACDHQDKDKMKALLALGANPNIANHYGRRPLDTIMDHYSYSYSDHSEIIGMLLSKGANPDLSPLPAMQCAPMHIAARNGNLGTLKQLSAHNPRLDQPSRMKSNLTPYMAALEGGRDAAADFLQEHGANIFRKDRFQRGALHFAARGGAEQHMDKLLEIPEMLKEIDTQDGKGRTPLHHACLKYHHDAAGKLLAKGAKADIFDDEGKAPLHRAIESSYMADFLDTFAEHLGDKADWNMPTKDGDTPLHVAIKNTQQPVFERLLDLGADPVRAGAGGMTPLQSAIMIDHEDMVKTLVKTLAEREIPLDMHRDNNGWTALHYAAIRDTADFATLLADAGSDLEARTNEGDTPLLVAAVSGQTDVLSFLLTRGADMMARNAKGQTAFDIALGTEDAGMLQALLGEMQKRDMPMPTIKPGTPKNQGPTP